MKLSEYFNNIKNNKVNETDKFLIYQKILDKQYQNKPKFNFAFKFAAYWVLSGFLFFAIFGVYFMWYKTEISNWIYVENSPILVNADYVAQVIKFEWNFFVSNNWEEIKTSNFKNGDLVFIDEWTEIIFNISSDIQAKIIWEASFSINKNTDWKWHEIELLYWDFIKVKWLEGQEAPVDLVLEDKLSISIDSEDTDFEVTKNNDEYKIDNKSDKKLVVTTINPDTGIEIASEIESNQIVAINTTKIDEIETQEELKDALEQWTLEQVFVLNSNNKVEEESVENDINENTNIDDIENDDVDRNWNSMIAMVQWLAIENDWNWRWDDEEYLSWDIWTGTEWNIWDFEWNFDMNEIENNGFETIENIEDIFDIDELEWDSEINSEIQEELWIWDWKLVITQEQSDVLSKNANSNFINNDLKNIQEYFTSGDSDRLNKSFERLSDRIQAIFVSVWLEFNKIEWSEIWEKMLELKDQVDLLIWELNQKYYIPLEYISILEDLSKKLSKNLE